MRRFHPTDRGYRLIYPRLTVLVSAGMKRPNAMAVAWNTPLSHTPPLVGVAVSPKRYTHSLIKEDKAFGINLPGRELLDETFFMGSGTGREFDKFAETGLSAFRGKKLGVPLIEECIVALECSLHDVLEMGDHDLFVGRIETAYADEKAVQNGWTKPERPIYWRDSSFKDVFGLTNPET
jgi:flavin reductase (DIM6/NTAB) family NADH-FMN oxidoreductase RutF